jgi:dephospho-CoA kinase
MVVGLSGRTGSGKTSVAAELGALGFAHVSFSQVLARLLEESGESASRDRLQNFGSAVRRELGQRWLQEQVHQTAESAGSRFVAIDGLRYPEDVRYFRDTYGRLFVHVHVTVPVATRRERFVRRHGGDQDFETAALHETEWAADELAASADLVIDNGGTRDELRVAVKKVLAVATRRAQCR